VVKRRQKPGATVPPVGSPRSTVTGPRPAPSDPGPLPTGVGRRPAVMPVVRRRRSTRPRWFIPATGALIIVLLAVVFYFLVYVPQNVPQNSPNGALLANKVMDEGRTHVAEGSPIRYVNQPPVSGPHYPSPKPWGVYTEPIVPGYYVHNLEHGGIAVLYDCPTGCPDIVTQLNNAFTTFPRDKFGEVKLVVTPYSGLPNGANVAALAWDIQKFYQGDFSVDKLLAFYNAHVDQGPEDIP
jgi:Protein of unknown function (DUF3105)